MLKNTISETHPELRTYLDGEKFTDRYALDLAPFVEAYDARDRQDTLEDLCRGKRVLHLGCTDHLELIDERIAAGRHLHLRLSESSAECIGIDINEETIEYLKTRHAVDNIVNVDILVDELPAVIADRHWDYIVLGEILEHVDDPIRFLSELRQCFSACCDNIMITVPNAFGRRPSKRYVKNQTEYINSDHRYWFSPFTLLKVMRRAGISPDSLIFADPPYRRWFIKGADLLLHLVGSKPLGNWGEHMAATIIGIGRLSETNPSD